ncbi:serologically defined colon cancer antigen 8 homolog isoform X2 [Oryzias melastigma]|uniref:serologically defined colon cancer antigen 8 homolog isoform X2 n=1 Tax=Oryzias melastigma TaxID=30732 RepID=UPI000CF83128|nr:serologically defined colon cancer antigen 8 homolog isoform X2 [Oryzias melastigma]
MTAVFNTDEEEATKEPWRRITGQPEYPRVELHFGSAVVTVVMMMMVEEDSMAAISQKTQSEAVNQLKSLLLKQGKEIPPPPLSSGKKSPAKRLQQESGSPVSQDLVSTVQNQTEYIQHLEAEIQFCKEELQEMKQRVRVVVVENEKLQSELKSKSLEKSVKPTASQNYTVADHRSAEQSELQRLENTWRNEMVADHRSMAEQSELQRLENTWRNEMVADHRSMAEQSELQRLENTWRNEMKQMKTIYKTQIESLEFQVLSLRKDLSVSQKECEEVKVRLRHKEKQAAEADGAPRVTGLCLNCAHHEAVLPETHTSRHVQAVDGLTKERDDLLAAVRALRSSQQEAQQREWTACLQVKQAIEMAEEANLQKIQVEVQCEQLSRELGRLREQLTRDAHALPQRLAAAREEGRAQARKQKEDLTQTMSSLSQRVTELEGHLERAHRDRTSLTAQLEEVHSKLTSQEQDNIKVSVDLHHQLSQVILKKEEAERELRQLNAKTSQQMEKAALEVERLNSELVGCRQHLEMVQKDGSQWQAEALSLAEQLANAQRQLHLTRQDREKAERTHAKETESVAVSAQKREAELMGMLQQSEALRTEKAAETDALLSAQNSLIKTLKEECCQLGAKLEDVLERKRSKLAQLALEKQHLEETASRLRTRCSNLEEQCVQHGRMHQRMKDRMQHLDQYCQKSALQVCEVLAEQNKLVLERTLSKPDVTS